MAMSDPWLAGVCCGASLVRPALTFNVIPCGNGPGAEAFQQHDVQELCRVLFDELESRLKGSPDQDLIKDLFQGFLSLSVVLPSALSRRCSPPREQFSAAARA